VQTLYTAATGMEALETKLDVIANNLANINTLGFKKDRANFEDLFYRQLTLPGTPDQSGQLTAVGTHVGLGARVSSVQMDFGQGALQETNRALDVAIQGNGFLQVQDANGDTLYTRAGNLSLNADGALVMGSAGVGRIVQPQINVPQPYTELSISPDGRILVREPGSTNLTEVAQLELAVFPNPEGLTKMGENLYAESDASSTPTTANPGDQGVGQLSQYRLEASDVEPVQELIDLITTQRSFELNSQAVQAGDQVLQLVSNLRRF
jgi:flagellar basal-body rod protein FlgG